MKRTKKADKESKIQEAQRCFMTLKDDDLALSLLNVYAQSLKNATDARNVTVQKK